MEMAETLFRLSSFQSSMSASISLILLSSLCHLTQFSEAQTPSRRMDPKQLEEFCKNFTVGHPDAMEFYSPQYPNMYPKDITCFRTITADIGYFVRIDFRDMFRIEPPGTDSKCDYDYLEIRDGDQGYSPLIGKFCGDKFPPIITSSGRSLWMRFSSDSTIQYTGFKAVYTFIENRLSNVPDIGKCAFETGGFQDFIGTANISVDRIDHAMTYDAPIDCVWTITAEKGFQIYIQFPEYQLDHPNDCHLNYIQVFDGKTDEEHRLKNFCGSVAESVTSKTSNVFIRFYAEKSGINSQFVAVFTAMRVLDGPNAACDPDTEYDCDDATCIHPDLVCNTIRNCKFGWDEESCAEFTGNTMLDFSASHVIIIIFVLAVILLGMCAGMMWNFVRKLSQDKEELAVSREKSLAASGASLDRLNRHLPPDPELPRDIPPAPGGRPRSRVDGSAGSLAGATSGGHHMSHQTTDSNGAGCYVPDGGFPFNSKF